MAGLKFDTEKPMFDLVDPHFHEDLAKVLTFGANKYKPNNWQKIKNAKPRYIAALERHINAIKKGETFDKESNLPHSAHVACNAMFLHYLERQKQMKIEIVRATEKPGELLKLACDHTMAAEPEVATEASEGLTKFLIKAGHRSVFEHCKITFKITGVSRSLMAQLTRHRAGVFTCQSQHYQDYRDVLAIKTGDFTLDKAIDNAYNAYSDAVRTGRVAKEVARQVLPNAASVNILWTIDARNLFDFLEQRCCQRNVPEMVNFAWRIVAKARNWWPVLFNSAGPFCVQHDCCNQGGMQAAWCEGKVELCK